MRIPSSRRTARLAAVAVVSAGALVTTAALALPASAQPQSGHHTLFVRQWDVPGHADGVTADPLTGKVIVTVNEDANSSLFTISAATGHLTHYAYNKPLPHKGGTDAISVYHGQILISASAPGTTGTAPKGAPAVYVVSLNPRAKVATVRGLFDDNAAATAVNGPPAGTNVTLALTDPDSDEVVPHASPKFGGDFMLDSQGDQELIFDQPRGWGGGASLSVLAISRSVDDTSWATSHSGALSKVALSGAPLQPRGQIFVKF